MTKTITVTDEEYAKIQDILGKIQDLKYSSLKELVGKDIFIRTVTMFYTGHLEGISGQFMKLSLASWIADTGRLADFMKGEPTSSLEVEPMGDILVNIDSVLDISLLQMSLPLDQK
jgi:hypothetical protein